MTSVCKIFTILVTKRGLELEDSGHAGQQPFSLRSVSHLQRSVTLSEIEQAPSSPYCLCYYPKHFISLGLGAFISLCRAVAGRMQDGLVSKLVPYLSLPRKVG